MVFNFFGRRNAQSIIDETSREDLALSRAREFEREERRKQLVSRVKKKKSAQRTRPFTEAGFKLGRSAGEFALAAQRQADFTDEQEAMRGIMGHGEKIWGTVGEPVSINHDLNPRQRGDRGTAEMFGF